MIGEKIIVNNEAEVTKVNIVPKKSEFDEYEIGIFDTDEGKMIEVSFKNGFWVMLKPEIADQLTLDIQDAINYLKEKK